MIQFFQINPSQLGFIDPDADGDCVIASMDANSSTSIWKVVPCDNQYTTNVLCQAHACDPEHPCDFDNGRFGTDSPFG